MTSDTPSPERGKHRPAVLVVALGALLAAGCGSTGDGPPAQEAKEVSAQQGDTAMLTQAWPVGLDRPGPWKAARGPLVRGDVTDARTVGQAVVSARVLSGDGQGDGPADLEATFRITGGAAAVFYLDLVPVRDWSAVEGVTVQAISNSADRLLVSFFVQSGSDGLSQETDALSLAPQASSLLSFDLRGSLLTRFGGARSAPGINEPEAVTRVGFSIAGLENPAGSVRFGELRVWAVGGGEQGASPAATETTSAQDGGFGRIRADAVEVAVYERIEIDVELAPGEANPYDPGQIAVEATFTSPTGRTYTVPAFWYVPHERRAMGAGETVRPTGPGGWKVRFAPMETGRWTYTLAGHRGGAVVEGTQPARFEAVEGPSPGYLVVSRRDPRYFEFERGGTYFPIGSNVAWYDQRGVAAYDTWFDRMADQGANYARIWFASWGFGIEWSDTGLGNYELRQRRAWELDTVLKRAEERGIYLMLCLINHGAFSISTNPEWDANPYNAALGGMLEDPSQFLKDPEAQSYFERRLRYIVARWGYSTHIMAWELWNEANLATNMIGDPAWVPWINRTAATLRALDHGRHLVTNSYSIAVSANDASWTSLDFVQEHRYGLSDWTPYIKRQVDDARARGQKPFFLGEYGLSGDVPDKEGIHLHDGLWGSFIAGAAGTAMLWWWDQYIEPNDLYGQFGSLARFLEGEDLAGQSLSPAPLERRPGTRIYRLGGSDRSFLWIRDAGYSFQGLQDIAMGSGLEGVVFPTRDGFELEVPVPAATGGSALWTVEQWDPQTGRRLSAVRATERDGYVTVSVPAFRKDLAYKIVRQPAR